MVEQRRMAERDVVAGTSGVMPGGPATALLRTEHRVILRGLDVLERTGRRIVSEKPVKEAALAELVELLRLFDQCHHVKEERHLFPAIRGKALPPSSAIPRMLAEHEEGRDYLRTLASDPGRATRSAAALLCAAVLREHIEREDHVIFPAADGLLSDEEQAALAARYDEVEPRFAGPGARPDFGERLARLERTLL